VRFDDSGDADSDRDDELGTVHTRGSGERHRGETAGAGELNNRICDRARHAGGEGLQGGGVHRPIESVGTPAAHASADDGSFGEPADEMDDAVWGGVGRLHTTDTAHAARDWVPNVSGWPAGCEPSR